MIARESTGCLRTQEPHIESRNMWLELACKRFFVDSPDSQEGTSSSLRVRVLSNDVI